MRWCDLRRDKGKRGTVLRRVDAEHLVIEASTASRNTSAPTR